MSSSRNNGDPDESVVCLDSSIDDVTIDNDNDTNNSVTEIINFDTTLPRGAAPDGFILIDETDEMEKSTVTENTRDNDDTSKDERETTKPMFKVFFRDEIVSRNYKKRVRDFFHRLVAAETKNDDMDYENLVLEVWSKTTGKKRSHDHSETIKTDNTSDTEDQDINALFRIEKRPTLQDRLDVPTYGKKFEQIMDSTSGTKKPDEEDEKNICRRKICCWNCEGNHSIRDCTVPRNHTEIAKNRNEFTLRSVSKVGRYHVEKDGQKFDHFVPGQISRDLKRALGIGDNQLPHHIYRMRILGYPPGWLKEARLQHSGMNLYNSDGFLEKDSADESGQIYEYGNKDQYDVKKIQDFPGFNVRPQSGTREDDKKYWKSDRYAANSKESLLAMINVKGVDGYKRKKLKRNVEPAIVNLEQIPTEMDVVEDTNDNVVESVSVNGLFIPPLPKSPPRPPLPIELEDGAAVDSPIAVNLDLESVASPVHVDSPSLADLERRKKQLLEELDDSSVPSPPTTPVTSRSCSSTSHASFVEQQETAVTSSDEIVKSVGTMSCPATPSRGTIKSVDLGTPILESTSPYSKLPSVKNFAKDVCDIMHFENLPDSTGKYEQMTGILQKVRTTLATNQQD